MPHLELSQSQAHRDHFNLSLQLGGKCRMSPNCIDGQRGSGGGSSSGSSSSLRLHCHFTLCTAQVLRCPLELGFDELEAHFKLGPDSMRGLRLHRRFKARARDRTGVGPGGRECGSGRGSGGAGVGVGVGVSLCGRARNTVLVGAVCGAGGASTCAFECSDLRLCFALLVVDFASVEGADALCLVLELAVRNRIG